MLSININIYILNHKVDVLIISFILLHLEDSTISSFQGRPIE